MNKRSTQVFASLGLLLTAAVWGFAFVVVKDSLDYVGSVYMVAIRFSIAAIGLAIIFCKRLKKIDKKHLNLVVFKKTYVIIRLKKEVE